MIVKGQQISAGNFIVSIGSYDARDVAIYSKFSGLFCRLAKAKQSKRLRKVKRQFKNNLNSPETFTFQFMQPDQIEELIQILKQR